MTSRSAGLQALMDGQTRRAIVNPSGVNLEALEARVVALEAVMLPKRAIFNFRSNANRMDDILHAVSQYCGITVGQLLTKRRRAEETHRRWIVMLLARKHTKMTFSAIGRAMGNLYHTTVSWGCVECANVGRNDKQYRAAYLEIESALKQRWGGK